MLQQLPSAKGNRTQHYKNLNHYSNNGLPAVSMERKFWQIDEALYWEALEMLPPVYVRGGFHISERLTGNIAAHFFKIGPHYWCAELDCSDRLEQEKMATRISRLFVAPETAVGE